MPVAEYTFPDQSRSAFFPQSGHATSSLQFFTSSSNSFWHAVHLYCKMGISFPSSSFAFDFFGRLDANGVRHTDNKHGDDGGDNDAYADNDPESPRFPFERNTHVHASNAGDQGGHGDNERNDRKQLHDNVQIVRDDGGVSIHRTR